MRSLKWVIVKRILQTIKHFLHFKQSVSHSVCVLGARATKTKLRGLYFSGKDSEVNEQLQNHYKKKQDFKDNTQDCSVSGKSQDKLLGRSDCLRYLIS